MVKVFTRLPIATLGILIEGEGTFLMGSSRVRGRAASLNLFARFRQIDYLPKASTAREATPSATLISMNGTIYLDLTNRFNRGRFRAIVCSGQAVVLHIRS